MKKKDKLVNQNSGLTSDYGKFLTDIKARIRQAQIRAGLAVNAELVLLYWNIGKDILTK